MPAWKFAIRIHGNKLSGSQNDAVAETVPLDLCRLGPLHGKVHNVKTKNKVSPEIGGKVSATQRNVNML